MAAGLTVGCGGGTAETPATQAPETQKDGGETTQAQASGGGESGEQVTIRFAGWLEVEEATSQLFKDLIAGFEAENRISRWRRWRFPSTISNGSGDDRGQLRRRGGRDYGK